MYYYYYYCQSTNKDPLEILRQRYPDLNVVCEWRINGICADIAILNPQNNAPLALFCIKGNDQNRTSGEISKLLKINALCDIAPVLYCIEVNDDAVLFYGIEEHGTLSQYGCNVDKLPGEENLKSTYQTNFDIFCKSRRMMKMNSKKKHLKIVCWVVLPIIWGLLLILDWLSCCYPILSRFVLTYEKVLYVVFLSLALLFPFFNKITFNDVSVFTQDE